MKRTFLSMLAASCLALSACETTPAPTIDSILVNPPSTAGTVLDEKALIAVESLYNAAVRVGIAAVDAGYLRGENAARVQEVNRNAYQALRAAEAAQAAGNATTYSAKLAEALNLIAQVQLLIPKRE